MLRILLRARVDHHFAEKNRAQFIGPLSPSFAIFPLFASLLDLGRWGGEALLGRHGGSPRVTLGGGGIRVNSCETLLAAMALRAEIV